MKASEVRSQWKETLDKAVEGQVITFERAGVHFVLQSQTKDFQVKNIGLPKGTYGTITPRPSITKSNHVQRYRITANNTESEPIITDKNKDMTFCKHNAVKGFCKMGCK